MCIIVFYSSLNIANIPLYPQDFNGRRQVEAKKIYAQNRQRQQKVGWVFKVKFSSAVGKSFVPKAVAIRNAL